MDQQKPLDPDLVRRHSVPVGDVVLSIAPPYLMSPWMGMGIPLLHGVLAANGLRTRVVRFLDDPLDSPEDIVDASLTTLWSDPPLETRLQVIRAAADRHSAWFDAMLAELLAGPEKIFGFSVWRQNVDVTLELSRRLKELRKDAIVVFGGPEAIESENELARDWVDVIVSGAGEGLIVPVVRACLDGRVGELMVFEKIWVHPRHRGKVRLLKRRAEIPPMPRIDYSTLLPVLVVQRWQSVPIVINVGCPFRCGFCANTSLYPEPTWGTEDRVTLEVQQISHLWHDMFGPDAPELHVEFCDATVNALPTQFDRILRAVGEAEMPFRPHMHGCFVVDHRVTPNRVRALRAAGFDSIFFGLETASPRMRRAMKKPGTIQSVRRALEVIRDAGEKKLRVNFNFIVGWPDESEADFHATMDFVEWASTLGIVTDVGVMPLFRTPVAMDTNLFADSTGPAKGFEWRSPRPAGSPEVRCRRFMSVFERFHRLLPVTSVIPRKRVIQWMAPHLPESFVDAWCAVHGETNFEGPPDALLAPSYVDSNEANEPEVEQETQSYPNMLEEWLEPTLVIGSELADGWMLAAFEITLDPQVAVLRFEHCRDERIAAIHVTPRDTSRSTFKHSTHFNVSYMDQFRGTPCAVDLALTREIVEHLSRHEALATTHPPRWEPVVT